MSTPLEVELQLTRSGITQDYFGELVPYDFSFQNGGIDALRSKLLTRPMHTYEQRGELLLEWHRDDPQSFKKFKQMYQVTEYNRGVVDRLNSHVLLINRAALEKKLTMRLYQRIFRHLLAFRDEPKDQETLIHSTRINNL